jgi:hypothetical protein
MEGAGTLTRATLAVLLLLAPAVTAQPAAGAGKVKVIADQDSAGPQGTNFLSLLMLLAAPQVDLLGITTVSGDQWMEPATVFALHAVELAGRTDVPVVKGAEQPLVNTRREQELREQLYGSHPTWHGSFNPDAPPPDRTWPPPGGFPKTKPRPGRAADFIIDTIRANPGEVVLYCAGPLTNIALAVRMDPGIVPLTKALYVMGASNKGGFELNWWWDPEAAGVDRSWMARPSGSSRCRRSPGRAASSSPGSRRPSTPKGSGSHGTSTAIGSPEHAREIRMRRREFIVGLGGGAMLPALAWQRGPSSRARSRRRCR